MKRGGHERAYPELNGTVVDVAIRVAVVQLARSRLCPSCTPFQASRWSRAALPGAAVQSDAYAPPFCGVS
jgi:hypothetical protein